MKRPSRELIIFCGFGIISGFWFERLFIPREVNGHWFAYVGMVFIVCIILMLFLNNLARKIILVISWFYISLNITSLLLGFPYRGQACIWLFIMSPVLLYCIIAIIYLTRPNVKKQFK